MVGCAYGFAAAVVCSYTKRREQDTEEVFRFEGKP